MRLDAALEPCRRVLRGPQFRWIDPRNFHVTLRFFGDLTDEQIARAAGLVAPVAAAMPRIACRAATIGALPSARRPNVIVLPLESEDGLEALAAAANAELAADFGPPDKPFKAHLTVARCRRATRFEPPAIPFDVALSFARVALFESSQAPTGVRYTALHAFALAGQVSAS